MGLAAISDARASVRVGWTTNAPANFTFDLEAIARAAEQMGVTAPVLVGCAEYANGRWGGTCTSRGGVHKICVKRTFDALEASQTLWHELTHAAQWDRGVRDFCGTSQARRDWSAYMAHPTEVEARANEPRAFDQPLAQ